jgi:AcrR family transcriptional regulator
METFLTFLVSRVCYIQGMRKGAVKEPLVRKRILDLSREIFFSRGFSKVTVDELAGKLGVSKKTIYAHFKSKDSVLDAVLERHLQDISSQVDDIIAAKTDFIERLYKLYFFISNSVYEKSPLFLENLQRSRPDLWKKVEDHRRVHVLQTFSKILDEGVRTGMVRDDADKKVAILVLLSAVQGILNPLTLASNGLNPKRAFGDIITVIFGGILTDTARAKYQKLQAAKG